MKLSKALRILGLNSIPQDRKALRQQYLKQCQLFHPDKPGGNASSFKNLQEAYRVLHAYSPAKPRPSINFEQRGSAWKGRSDHWDKLQKMRREEYGQREAVRRDILDMKSGFGSIIILASSIFIYWNLFVKN